jgi:hypothetical protein
MELERTAPLQRDIREGWFLLARMALYATVVTLAVHCVVVAADSGYASVVAQEFGPIEILQAILAGLGFIGFVVAARAGDETAAVAEIVAAGLLFMTIRELDYPLDLALGQGSYKYFNTPVVAWALYVIVRSRKILPAQVAAFVRSPAGYLAMFGLFFAVMYGQVIGQKELWLGLSPERETMMFVKRTVEEISEMPGYFLLAFASLEAVLRARQRRRHALGMR